MRKGLSGIQVAHLAVGWLVPMTFFAPGQRTWGLVQAGFMLLTGALAAFCYFYAYGQFLGYGCMLRRGFPWEECKQTCAQLHEAVPAFDPFTDAAVVTWMAIAAAVLWLGLWLSGVPELGRINISSSEAHLLKHAEDAAEEEGEDAKEFLARERRGAAYYATANLLWWLGGALLTGAHLLYVRPLRGFFVVHCILVGLVTLGVVLLVSGGDPDAYLLWAGATTHVMFALVSAPFLRHACVLDVAQRCAGSEHLGAVLVHTGARTHADLAIAEHGVALMAKASAHVVEHVQMLTARGA